MTVHLSFYEEDSDSELASFTDAPIPAKGDTVSIEVQVSGDQWIDGLEMVETEYEVVEVSTLYKKVYATSCKEMVHVSVIVR